MNWKILTFYKFLPIEGDLFNLRQKLKAKLIAHAAKGTVLLSHEGVNGSLAVHPSNAESLAKVLASDDFFGPLQFKENDSDIAPFRRLLIRIKKEIITFRVPEIDPLKSAAPYLSPKNLKHWYDQGKDMIVIDTRNDFEIRFGTFKNAQNYHLHNFTDFVEVAKQFPEDMKDKTIVTFCTGGIRCEKAAPYLQKLGFKNVYQLEGGILNYFKECGGDHYEGECFVFDHRVALDANLQTTTTSYCTLCQVPIYDPLVKKTFTVNERYCSDCLPKIPPYLKKRWSDFLEKNRTVATTIDAKPQNE